MELKFNFWEKIGWEFGEGEREYIRTGKMPPLPPVAQTLTDEDSSVFLCSRVCFFKRSNPILRAHVRACVNLLTSLRKIISLHGTRR